MPCGTDYFPNTIAIKEGTMQKQNSSLNTKPATVKNERGFPAFQMMAVLMAAVILASVLFLNRYHPSPSAPAAPVTLQQKMAHLETGVPLPGQNARPEIPRWMMALILGFVALQLLPLLLAAHKARLTELTRRELRQIEFLTETPLYLGLLGSLLGVAMTQFLSGTLSAPLAYLTTISGILLYLFGRFSILVSLPSSNDFTPE